MTRAEILTRILAKPDPPDLPRRGYHYTLGRMPLRDPWEIKRELGIAYAERMRQEWTGGDISCVVSVRREARLRVVKRSA